MKYSIFAQKQIRSVGNVDWSELKRQILAALGPDGVKNEFSVLGLRFEGTYNSKGKATCHAMGREDVHPSAFVNVVKGIYHSKGETVETLNLFDYALKYGGAKFGDWIETIRYYASLVNIEVDAKKDSKGRILEAIYDYTNETGNLLYQVIRYRLASGKKDFRQRRPDGQGGWIYDLEGVSRVLYKLPELAADMAKHVLIVEGEKDADRLNRELEGTSIEIIATTSAQGANDTGRWGSYAETLRDRTCVVIPDNDPTGLRHARGVCSALHGIAASVKMVQLPGVGQKGDVSDWLDQGNELDDFMMLVVSAEVFNPAVAAEVEVDQNRDATAVDLIAANAGTKWLWPQWIPFGVLTLLTAEPSTGKTRLGLDLTKRIALAMEWPDGSLIDLQGRRPIVLWVPADSQHSELADAPKAFSFPPESVVLNTTVGELYGGTELEEAADLKDLEERIKRQNPAIVFIDTVTNTSDAKSQDTSDAKRQYKPLQEIDKRTGAAMVCVTHTNLAGKTLGRRADEKTRVTIRLECPDPENQPKRRKLSVVLSRMSVYPSPLGITMGDDGNSYDGNPPTSPSEQAAHPTIKPPSPSTRAAIGWLLPRLRSGPERLHALRKECDTLTPPISAKSLYAARDLMGIEEFESAGPGSTKEYVWWKLPAIQESNGHID